MLQTFDKSPVVCSIKPNFITDGFCGLGIISLPLKMNLSGSKDGLNFHLGIDYVVGRSG